LRKHAVVKGIRIEEKEEVIEGLQKKSIGVTSGLSHI